MGSRAAALLVAGLCLAPGCARALREPPPLSGLGGGGTARAPEEVDSLLAEADLLYAARTPDSVREALEAWLAAARSDGRRVEGLIGAARAGVWLSMHDESRDDRHRDAGLAVEAAQWCGRLEPANPACSFWLGAALGAQADVRRSTALDALPRIVEAFQRAAAADPGLEDAGPDRALALVYARAPGWPAGPGDPDLALEHARKAEGLRPEFPPNSLALGEALVAAGSPAEARREYERALALARDWADREEPDAAEWIKEAEEALGRLSGS